MSVESWGGDSACYVRFHFCGHSVLISEVRVVDPASLECPVCGELSPLRAEASVPDIVPSADLAWQGAKRTKLDVLETGNRQNVRPAGTIKMLSKCALDGVVISVGSRSVRAFFWRYNALSKSTQKQILKRF